MYSIFEDKLKIVSLNNFNKYLYSGKSEIKMNININNSSEKLKKKHCDNDFTYRVFNLKVDRQLSLEYFTSDAIYNGSAGTALYYYMCRSWQDC
jgi:hypothetical protein